MSRVLKIKIHPMLLEPDIVRYWDSAASRAEAVYGTVQQVWSPACALTGQCSPLSKPTAAATLHLPSPELRRQASAFLCLPTYLVPCLVLAGCSEPPVASPFSLLEIGANDTGFRYQHITRMLSESQHFQKVQKEENFPALEPSGRRH